MNNTTYRERGYDDDGLLRPFTHETGRSRWGSDSTAMGTGSRSGSLFDGIDKTKRSGLIKPQEIRSMEDLQQVKDQRNQGEEYLRSALSIIGTLATDITRRLDYTYYGLLEKIAALNITIASFHELSESTSRLFSDFQRETSGLEQDVRKQTNDFKEFRPQTRRIEALEERMRIGKTRAGTLSNRLEEMRHEIEHWERREVESQKRINQRLRFFWGIITAGICAIMIAAVIQHRQIPVRVGSEIPSRTAVLPTSSARTPLPENERTLGFGSQVPTRYSRLLDPSSYSWDEEHQVVMLAATATSTKADATRRPTDYDPLRIFDEL